MLLFRGSDLEALNSDEFVDNDKSGDTYDIIDIRVPEGGVDKLSPGEALAGKAANTEILSRSEREVSVTGGFSTRIGTAVAFAHASTTLGGPLFETDDGEVLSSSNLGHYNLSLILDGEKIPHPVREVEYSPEWFDNNPGVFCWVQVTDGAIRVNGKIRGAITRNRQGIRRVVTWDRARIESSTTEHFSQQEVVVMNDEINLDHAMVSMASYYTPRVDGKGMGGPPTPDEDVLRKRTRVLWEKTVERMARDPRNFWVVVLRPNALTGAHVRGPWEGRQKIKERDFKWAYNGEQFYDSWAMVPERTILGQENL